MSLEIGGAVPLECSAMMRRPLAAVTSFLFPALCLFYPYYVESQHFGRPAYQQDFGGREFLLRVFYDWNPDGILARGPIRLSAEITTASGTLLATGVRTQGPQGWVFALSRRDFQWRAYATGGCKPLLRFFYQPRGRRWLSLGAGRGLSCLPPSVSESDPSYPTVSNASL